jgi:hypothetical protein
LILAKTLVKKRDRAEVYLKENTRAEKGLTRVCSKKDVETWKLNGKEAQRKREIHSQAMDYFTVRAEEGKPSILPIYVAVSEHC